jgi:hypothetical protein
MLRSCRLKIALLPALLFAALVCAPALSYGAEKVKVRFSRDILPILSDNCFYCHGPDEKTRQADLRLDTQDGALRKDNPVILPGKSAESELVRRILSTDPDEMMPPAKSNRTLTPRERELLVRWIDEGATWGQHWAYEAPQRPELPPVKNTAWPKNAIDRFILSTLEDEGLQPSLEASKERLLRRVTLDLTGLPPTILELQAFLEDNSPNAYDAVVDRLLASPRYGERMAWEWLDAARYADSNGYQGDQDRTMWPWRDWVVRSLNENMPYDRFTIEQIAGDLLPEATKDQKLATAFNRNHMINGEGGRIAEENRIEYLMDQTETLSTVWLGLTMTCARCHDHKFDPLKQREYYQLLAYFNQTPVDGVGRGGQTKPVLDFATPKHAERRKELAAEFDAVTKRIREKEQQLRDAAAIEKDGKYESTLPPLIESALRKGPGDRAEQNRQELIAHFKDREPDYIKLLNELEKARVKRNDYVKTIPQVMIMEELPQPRETFVLTRGAYDKPTDKVAAGVPAVLNRLPADASANRLSLAKWLVDPANPLTARVTVNRYWQMFFGTGLVKTVEDFGVQGESPSHPELLDWLATEFVRTGWNVKALHRLIVTSATYRQSSKVTPALWERDSENRLLARGPRYRLPSWMLRDQALAVSGLLVDKRGGPPVKPYQPEGIWEEATFGKIGYKQDDGEALYRRSLYIFWRRIVAPTMFFDTASRQVCTVKAVRTNTPLHALAVMNDTTYVEAARALAQRVLEQASAAPEARVELAFQAAALRRPTAEELKILLGNLDKLRASFAKDKPAAEKLLAVGQAPRNKNLDPIEHAALASLCTLILNLDEVLNK